MFKLSLKYSSVVIALRNTKFINSYKNFSSKVYNNIVQFSNDINTNELKIPVYDKNYSIFYKKEDKISDFLKRIEGVDPKIQKVECLNYKGEPVTNLNESLLDLAKHSFVIKLNGHMNIKYFPSLNMIVSKDNRTKFSIFNNFNSFLYNNFSNKGRANIPTEESIKELKKEVESNLNNLLETYEKLFKHCQDAKERLDKKFKSTMNLYINLGVLFFLLNVIVFYVLIYQLYGWDTIEPITYIVGNIYWIIGLSFFVYKKKKLDFSFFFSKGFKRNFYEKNGNLLGFNEIERNFLTNEIKEIKQFKEALGKL